MADLEKFKTAADRFMHFCHDLILQGGMLTEERVAMMENVVDCITIKNYLDANNLQGIMVNARLNTVMVMALRDFGG